MPVLSPIQGTTTIRVGSTTTFTDASAGGTWSSTDTSVATVNASTGVVTGVSAGYAQIVYTVGSDTTAVNITVQSALNLTNGINFNEVFPILQSRILWQSQGLISDSNRYYEDFHPLNDTNIVQDMKPNDNLSLSDFLYNRQRAVIMEMLNSVWSAPQVIDMPKTAFYRSNMPLPLQFVANSGQFVGLRLFVGKGDHSVKLNSVQLYFTEAKSFNLYLYNDFIREPIMTIPVTTEAYNWTNIDLGEDIILSNLVPTAYKGGRWYFGYWQDDLGTAQAIYYPCGYNKFHPIEVMAFSAPQYTFPDGYATFARNNIGANNLMYGMNLEISTFVDATNTIVQNAHLFDELQGLMMAVRNVQDMIFSYRTNSTQRNIQGNVELGRLYAELNGMKEGEDVPYVMGLRDMVSREIKRVKQALQPKVLTTIGTR